MQKIKRYYISPEIDRETGSMFTTEVEDEEGEFIKYEDIRNLLNHGDFIKLLDIQRLFNTCRHQYVNGNDGIARCEICDDFYSLDELRRK